MIYESLEIVAGALNTYLKNALLVAEDKVIVSNIVNHDGTIPTANNDKLVMCVINIEQETNMTNAGFTHHIGQPQQGGNPPANINLYVLFASYLNNYTDSAKLISSALLFFRENSIFMKSQYPDMDSTTDKLVLELLKTDFETIQDIWGALGARYVPSLVYKMRILMVN